MAKFGIAQPVRRVEDPRLLLGNGNYTDDIALADTAVGIVLRSPHAAATITRVDVTAAKAAPGVLGVYTAADLKADDIGPLPCGIPLKNRDGSDRADPPHSVLADGAVRHVGDPVAFIVAETHQQARDAAELVEIEYDSLPSCTDLGAAMDADAALVWPDVKNNVVFDWETGDKAKTEELFASAAHVAKLDRGQQPYRRQFDGSARGAGRLRRRPLDAATPTPRAAGASRTCWAPWCSRPARSRSAS